MRPRLIIVSAITASLSVHAEAYDWSAVTKVSNIEVTYMPTQLLFKADSAGGSCPAGSLLQWNIRGANATEKAQNAQAVLSALMTAQAMDRTVTILGNNSGCTVDYIYINR